MSTLTQGLTPSRHAEGPLCGETVWKLTITLQTLSAQSGGSSTRITLFVAHDLSAPDVSCYMITLPVLLCPMPIQGSSSPLYLFQVILLTVDISLSLGSVSAVLESHWIIRCATGTVVAGSWQIAAQRSETGDR